MRLITDNAWYLSEAFTVYGRSEELGTHALAAVVNSLAAAGAVHVIADVVIEYPPRSDRSCIYKMKKNMRKLCERRQMELLEVRYQANPLLCVPAVTVNGMAEIKMADMQAENGCRGDEKNFSANMSGKAVVLSKWIGMDGMLQIASEMEEELKRRFAPAFMRRVMSHRQELFADAEIRIGRDTGSAVIKQITRGGIFAALWELSEEMGCGFDLELKRIPILQETVEICEYFRLNPYQLISAGSILFVTEDAGILTERLRERKIPASVIGYTVQGSDKIIRNGEDVRYIDRPAPDEIFKIYKTDDREEDERC